MFSLRVTQHHRPSMRVWSLVVVLGLGMLPSDHPSAMPASSSFPANQPTAKILDQECLPDHDLSEGFSDNGGADTFLARFNLTVSGRARSGYSPLLRTRHGTVTVDLTCDVPVTDIIENPSDSDLFTFSVEEGEIVHIKVVETPPAGANFSLYWRVLDKNGVPAPDCGFFSILTEQDCGPLPANGSPYQIEVQDGNQDATGSYSVHLQRVTAANACDHQATLTCDIPVAATIDSPLDSDLFTFSVEEGEIVHIKVVETPPAGANFSLYWRVLDKNGAPAPDCGFFSILTEQDCGPLPANGSPYQIEVQDGNQDATGSYTVRINYLINGCPPLVFTNFNYLPLVLRQP
jgi:hypothetical protein